MNKNRRGYTRGLLAALLFITLTTVNEIKVKAETVDDLKAYLGMTVKKRKNIMIDNSSAQSNTSTNSDTAKRDKEISEIEQLKIGLDKLEIKFQESMTHNIKAKDIVNLLIAINDTKTQINKKEELVSTLNNTDIDDLIEQSRIAEIEMQKGNKFGTYNYNIGSIGNSAISPSNKAIHLITPYGYKVKTNGSYEKKHTGIDLGIGANNPVLSQWNGKIAYIENDSLEGMSVVTIYHGQGLYTVYSHLITNKIYIGKPVKQGDVIGTVGNTTKLEESKVNHINYQVILDGKYVNPLLIFGERSKNIYEDWFKKSYDTYAIEEDEEYYYVPTISKDNPNSIKPKQNTIEGAAEVIDNYILPDPGVVQ